MRLVDRYICRQVLSHALLGLVVFTFVFFVPQLVRLMDLFVRHTTSWGEIGLLFASVFPGIFTFTIPMAVLVGMLIGLGRLSADSELIAMNSLGMGPRRLLAPLGVLALVATLITGVFTLWIGPIAVHTSRGLQSRVLSSQASFEIQPRVFDERFPNLVLYIQDVSAVATRWHGIFLAGSNAEKISRLTLAEDAIVIADREEGKLELHLRNGSVHEVALDDPDQYSLSAFGQRDWPINAGGFGKAEAPGADPGRTSHAHARGKERPRLAVGTIGTQPAFCVPRRLHRLRADCHSARRSAAPRWPGRRIRPHAASGVRVLRPVRLR